MVEIVKQNKLYTPEYRETIYDWREKHKEEYRDYQRLYYQQVRSKNEEMKKQFNANTLKAVKKYYAKKREEDEANGIVRRPRGRPKKDLGDLSDPAKSFQISNGNKKVIEIQEVEIF